MEEWGEERDALINLFGKVRDEWMDEDLTTWIGANRLYPGVPDALKFASSTIYIVTTKQSRFADALLQELAGVTIPPEKKNIWSWKWSQGRSIEAASKRNQNIRG
ncbi:hypothetical protein GBA52_022807 [Prunus armeniaca]|nr:hypothetical protein GBA52_022807 [Prunus armeniaca]